MDRPDVEPGHRCHHGRAHAREGSAGSAVNDTRQLGGTPAPTRAAHRRRARSAGLTFVVLTFVGSARTRSSSTPCWPRRPSTAGSSPICFADETFGGAGTQEAIGWQDGQLWWATYSVRPSGVTTTASGPGPA